MIDIEDFYRCTIYSWYVDSLGYVATNGADSSYLLSKWIYYYGVFKEGYPLGAPEITFADGNRLNYRRANLRLFNRSERTVELMRVRYAERELPTGVKRKPGKRRRPFQALAGFRGRRYSFGCYETPEKAAQAYTDGLAKLQKGLSGF